MLPRYHNPMNHFCAPTNYRGNAESVWENEGARPTNTGASNTAYNTGVSFLIGPYKGATEPHPERYPQGGFRPSASAPGGVDTMSSEPQITLMEKRVLRWAEFTGREPKYRGSNVSRCVLEKLWQ